MPAKPFLGALLCLAISSAWAVNKCVGPDNRLCFRIAPARDKGETLTIRPGVWRRSATGRDFSTIG